MKKIHILQIIIGIISILLISMSLFLYFKIQSQKNIQTEDTKNIQVDKNNKNIDNNTPSNRTEDNQPNNKQPINTAF